MLSLILGAGALGWALIKRNEKAGKKLVPEKLGACLIPLSDLEMKSIHFHRYTSYSPADGSGCCPLENRPLTAADPTRDRPDKIGEKTAALSFPIAQEFRVWCCLSCLMLINKGTLERKYLSPGQRQLLFEELTIKGDLEASTVIRLLGLDPEAWGLNASVVEGNQTVHALYEAYFSILQSEGWSAPQLLLKRKIENIWDLPARKITNAVRYAFGMLEIHKVSDVSDAHGESEHSSIIALWQVLSSSSGENRISTLCRQFGYSRKQAAILAEAKLPDGKALLSEKAMRKIIPFLRENRFTQALGLAGYRQDALAGWLSEASLGIRKLCSVAPLLVKAVMDIPGIGNIDQIHISIAPELEEPLVMTERENDEDVRQALITKWKIPDPGENEIRRYRLYQELEFNGFRTICTDTPVPADKLFSPAFIVRKIIPDELLPGDDSLSNHILCIAKLQPEKYETLLDQILMLGGNADLYLERVEALYNIGRQIPGAGISEAKYQKLTLLDRDLGAISERGETGALVLRELRSQLGGLCGSIKPVAYEEINAELRRMGGGDLIRDLKREQYRRLKADSSQTGEGENYYSILGEWCGQRDFRSLMLEAAMAASIDDDAKAEVGEPDAGSGEFIEKLKSQINAAIVTVTRPPGKKSKTEKAASSANEVMLKVDAHFDEAMIRRVVCPGYRSALMNRLRRHDNDPRRAFSGFNNIRSNPVFVRGTGEPVPEHVLVNMAEADPPLVRVDLNPINFRTVEDIFRIRDWGIRNLVLHRFEACRQDPMAAFGNLTENPIWLNREKGISIRQVTVVKEEAATRSRNGDRNLLKPDPQGIHHVEFYRDGEGVLHDRAVTNAEAEERTRHGQPAVDRHFNIQWKWKYELSLRKGDYVFIPPPSSFVPDSEHAPPLSNAEMSLHIYRLENVSWVKSEGMVVFREYIFTHHLELPRAGGVELPEISSRRVRSLRVLETVRKLRTRLLEQDFGVKKEGVEQD